MQDLTANELRLLKSLGSPEKIQSYLDSLKYNLASTAYSPRLVMQKRTAHCLEGAALAAAALRIQGHPPLILDFEAERDSDHVVALFQYKKHWGSIGVSNFSGLRFRAPVYRSLRELAMSYFDDYFNLRGERTLRTFSRPVNLKRFDRLHWMSRSDNIWFIAEYLCDIPHTKILAPSMIKSLSRVSPRKLRAGKLGMRKSGS